MHFERNMTPADDQGFETLDALLDGPFAICAIIVDEQGRPVDYRFLRVSSCFEDATGFRDVEGRTVREIVPEVEPKWIELYGRVALDRVPARFVEESKATGREYEVRAAPLDPPGRFVMTFQDLTERLRLEAEREAALSHAQDLLRELGHRVMNSFAAISAILAMEARATPPEARAALDRVQRRVQALASLYRRLDGAPAIDRIELADYLGGLVDSFGDSLGAAAAMTIERAIGPVSVPTRAAVPLALIVNELLTNAVKHAFGDGRNGRIVVSLWEEHGLCRLCVADDGDGMAEVADSSGIGQSLVTAFVQSIEGEMSVETSESGTSVTVTFRV